MAEIQPTGAMEPDRLQERIAELERLHLVTVVEILEEISGSLNFVDIMQAVTKKLGKTSMAWIAVRSFSPSGAA
jgi:hypothetical protein